MHSFIIIGLNEGERLAKCLNSINCFCANNLISNYEIVYVDSNSIDGSAEYAAKTADKVILIANDINAALARNIGASHASGSTLFFIDGDMELVSEFYQQAFNNHKIKYPFISGYFRNNYFDHTGNFLFSEDYTRSKPKSIEEYQSTTGGLFIISKALWQQVNGMDSKFTTGEDLDLGLRLSKLGYRLLRINKLFAYHNTEQYSASLKLFNIKEVYARAILYRKHLLNPYIYKEFVFRDPTLLIFIATTLLLPVFKTFFIFIFYFFLAILKSWIISKRCLKNLPFYILYQISRDIINAVALIFFFPRAKTNYTIKVVKNGKNN